MQKLIAAIPDVMIIAGGAAIAFGAGLLHLAAGFIVGGLLVVCFGMMAAKAAPTKAAE